MAKNIPKTVELIIHHDVIKFQIKKLKKLQKYICNNDFVLNSFSIKSNGMNAINIKKTIPFTGQDKPKRNPDKILSNIYFLYNFKFI